MSELTKALVKFQKTCPAIIRDKTAEIVSKRTGGKYKYEYADLAGTLGPIRQVLSDCGLFPAQVFDRENGSTLLITRIMHESGELMASTIELPINGLSPQEVGSVITYYRRYALTAILGLAAEDDDGQVAQQAGATHGNKLTQQLKDSIDLEHQNGRHDFVAADQYVKDPVYSSYLKDTPKGKCWKVTAIQQAMRDFVHDLEGQFDAAELVGFLKDNSVALDACAIALPNWYYGKQGSDVPGIEKRIADKKAELAREPVDNPAKYLHA